MLDKTSQLLTYNYTNLQKRIVTPVYLYGISTITPRDTVTSALWDTGAMLSVITPQIQSEIGLVPIGAKLIHGATGVQEVDIVMITITLPNNILKQNVEVAVCNFSNDLGMIIGMDIITLGDFTLLHGGNHTRFSFLTPPQPD